MVTNKNKEQFEEWFTDNYDSEFMPDDKFSRYIWFIKQPFEMQIGVYEKYYDSLGYHIYIESYLGGGQNVFYPEIIWRMDNHVDTFWKPKYDNLIEYLCFIDRNEAYVEAFKKADACVNEKL